MPIRFVNAHGLADLAHGFVVAALIIWFLYVGGSIIEPLVIAGLLSFILAPVMRRLRAGGVPKGIAAIFSVALTLSIIGVLGTTLVLQVRQLAEELPTYESNLRAKIKLVGGMPVASGVLERASDTLRDLQEELASVESAKSERSTTMPDSSRPLPVEIHQPEPRGFEVIANLP
jgi:predicted PurR-regulated permease PerM